MRTSYLFIAVSLWCLAVAKAQAACTPPDLKIVGYNKEKIGIFSAEGKFLREVPKEMLPLGLKVLECNSLGLGLVQLVANAPPPPPQASDKPGPQKAAAAAPPVPAEWIDLLDVKVSQEFQPPCVPPPSSARDKKQHGTAGVAKGDCVPVAAPPAKPAN